MYLEQLPSLKYKDKDPLLQCLEYSAILKLVADGDDAIMARKYPEVAENFEDLQLDLIMGQGTPVMTRALEMLHKGDFDHPEPRFALRGFYEFIDSNGADIPDWFGGDDDVIETVKPVASPVRNTNEEIQNKKRDQKRIARELYQRKLLGDAFVPTDTTREARQRVEEHLHGGGIREDLTPMASQLALDNNLTEDQTNTLLNEIMLKHFDKLNHHNVIEQQLLSEPTQKTKSIFFLWHQLSRKYKVGEPIYMSTNQGVAMARVSKTDYPDLIKTMRKMKILKRLGKGQRGANSNLSATYTLLVSVGG